MRATEVVEDDARRRRIEAALDVVIEMRALFNEQNADGAVDPAELARLALCRRLGARLAPLEHFGELPQTQALVDRSREWSNTPIELAIAELTCLLDPPDSPPTQR